jgi:hypothetical protein
VDRRAARTRVPHRPRVESLCGGAGLWQGAFESQTWPKRRYPPTVTACRSGSLLAPRRRSRQQHSHAPAGHSNTSEQMRLQSCMCEQLAASCQAVAGPQMVLLDDASLQTACADGHGEVSVRSGLLRGAWRHGAGDYVTKPDDALPARRTFKASMSMPVLRSRAAVAPRGRPLSHRDSSAQDLADLAPTRLWRRPVSSSQPTGGHLSSSAPASESFAADCSSAQNIQERSQSALRSLPQMTYRRAGGNQAAGSSARFACTAGSDTEDCSESLAGCGASYSLPSASGRFGSGCWPRRSPDSRWTLAR